MSKHYVVILTEDERTILGRRLSTGTGSAREHARARILLKADSGPLGPGGTDETIAEALEVSTSTIERVRKRFVQMGLDAAIHRRPSRREYRGSWMGSRRRT
jgi:hypothetical protein